MTNTAIQMILYCAILIVLSIPLGGYIGKVMNGEKTILTKFLSPIENGIYKVLRINKEEDMDWKKYAVCAGVFSVISLAALWLILMLQNILPLNPEGQAGTSWHLGFNIAAGSVTNTNWQAYSGESALSYFSQIIGLGVQNFVTPAVGMAVLFALVRGFVRVKKKGIGNFYTDVTKSTVYVLIPLSLIAAVFLVARGVPQTFRGHEEVQLLEPVAIENEDGTTTIVDKQIVPLGPAGSQISIKQLGTNGGGFYGADSAHPLENPDPWTNLFEMISLLLIPTALCFTFCRNIKEKRHRIAVFLAMFIMLALALAVAGINASTPFLNTSIGLVMLFVRFLTMFGALAIAGGMAQRKRHERIEGK